MAEVKVYRSRESVRGVIAWAVAAGLASSVLATASAEAHLDDAQFKCHGKVATIVGTQGDDHIIGTARADVIVGRGGTDRIDGGAGDDFICGGRSTSGHDPNAPAAQELRGGRGDDVIVGGPGRDLIFDRDGTDLLIGRGGSDYLEERDRRPDGQADVLRGGAGRDRLIGSYGADDLRGGAGNDGFTDRWGDNVHRGGGGNDVFETGEGDDVILGGSGTDTSLYVTIATDRNELAANCGDVTADLSIGRASGSGFGVDSLTAVENIASGGGQDVLIGDDHSNTLYPGTLTACPGVASQRETIAGGAGSDSVTFDSSRWDVSQSVGPVEVDLAAGTAVQQSPDTDVEVHITLSSVENADGTDFADILRGDDGPNRIEGGSRQGAGDLISGRGGDDSLFGSGGRDTIYGDAGVDTLRGRAGNDRLDGGLDRNSIDGGPGRDHCQNPDRFNGALNCEA